MVVIEPSILSADYARFGEQAREVEAAVSCDRRSSYRIGWIWRDSL